MRRERREARPSVEFFGTEPIFVAQKSGDHEPQEEKQ
jgi:hypothetical protein